MKELMLSNRKLWTGGHFCGTFLWLLSGWLW